MEPLGAEDPRQVGRYTLAGRLGVGGMGTVFLGLSPAGRRVAVKLVHPGLAADPVFRSRFRQEVAAARKVSGAYTAPVVDAGDGDPPWLATALVMGPSLADAVHLHGPLGEVSLWRLAAGLAEAMGEVHSCGLVHRDLKPSNVMLADDGPRVIDFGIARALDGTRMTGTGMIIGTPSFMSPEQATGAPVGPASDVFSFGSVLTFAGTGEGPFGTGSTVAMAYQIAHGEPKLAGLPATLGGLVRRCLAKRPEDRASLADLMQIITANVTAVDAAGSFWPEALARAIDSYRTRLTPGAEVMPPAPPELAPQQGAPTVSGPQAAGEPLPVPTRRPFRRWLAVVIVVVALGGAAATTALLQGGRPPATAGHHTAVRPAPAISRSDARGVLTAFASAYNRASLLRDDSLFAGVETGISYDMDIGSNRWFRVSQPGHKNWATMSLTGEALYIPLQSAATYPRWFAARITQAFQGGTSGPEYVLFTEAARGASWKAACEDAVLASPAPEIALDKNGYAEQEPLAGARLSIPPGTLAAITARFLDGGGQLTDPWAADLADRSDQQFWHGKGFEASHGATDSDTHLAAPAQVLGLRTAGGGALVFYGDKAELTLAMAHGKSFVLKIPGYYTFTTNQTSARLGYIDQFAVYDPPHGTPSVVGQSSGIVSRG